MTKTTTTPLATMTNHARSRAALVLETTTMTMPKKVALPRARRGERASQQTWREEKLLRWVLGVRRRCHRLRQPLAHPWTLLLLPLWTVQHNSALQWQMKPQQILPLLPLTTSSTLAWIARRRAVLAAAVGAHAAVTRWLNPQRHHLLCAAKTSTTAATAAQAIAPVAPCMRAAAAVGGIKVLPLTQPSWSP